MSYRIKEIGLQNWLWIYRILLGTLSHGTTTHFFFRGVERKRTIIAS